MDPIINIKKFSEIDLEDEFFDSLRSDYREFNNWFMRKAETEAKAYVVKNSSKLEGFLHLKIENEEITDIVPSLPLNNRLKIATFKINPHGTKLGERFLKKIFDIALDKNVSEIYVTVFPKHQSLVDLFMKYGFVKIGEKTTINGVEDVMLKDMIQFKGNILLDFPLIYTKECKKYILSIYPEYHTRLFPDSILNSETYEIVKDISHTNSIEKVYICFMDLSLLKPNDILIIYRTKDGMGSAWYRSVVTSVCTVVEIKQKKNFAKMDDFLEYCAKNSVFNQDELKGWFSRKGNLYVIKMVYNAAFSKRINRKYLIENIGLDENAYWGFLNLSSEQFNQIIKDGQVHEGIIVN